MLNVMAALKDRRTKAEAKVVRASKALETAEKELSDVIAAERVMADITGESVDTKPTGAFTERDREIAKLLGTSIEEAKSPAELHPIYVAVQGDDLNLEAFRTALWRLLKKTIQGEETSWTVKADNGRYWRVAVPGTSTNYDELLGGDDDFP